MPLLQNITHSRFFIIFLLTFVNGLSMTMLFPVLPFIIKFYGEPEVVLWILFATFSFFQFIAAPILWALSDKYGRKPILILTQAGTFLSWIVLAVASQLPEETLFWFVLLPILVVFLSRMFDGITWGNASVAQAVIADLTEKEERAKVFGMNGAVFGLSMMVWPALGSLSMWVSWWYLWVAVLWASISAITLAIMVFFLRESLQKDECTQYVKISFKELNFIRQIRKWWGDDMIRTVIIVKFLMFSAFVAYTSTATLYLIDEFWFTADKVGYYLTFTGSFIIFHQSVSIKLFLSKLWDRLSLSAALWILALWFFMMWASQNIYIFTVFYFFTVMGIALSFTTMWSLLSRSVDSKHQGEVMGMSTSIESFISIGIPILATYIYGLIHFPIYWVITILPFFAFLVSIFLCPNKKLRPKK